MTGDDGWNLRMEAGGWLTPDLLHAASPVDRGPRYLMFRDGCDYADSRCGWCWLGAAHTVAAHQQDIDRWVRRQTR